VKQIPLFGVVHTEQMETVMLDVLRSGRVASGKYVTRFEQGLAALTGHLHVVSTVDMTSAMLLALRLANVGPGDEVLTTAFACLATNSAIAQCGALPRWVDVKPNSVEIDMEDVLRKIGPATKALILYHVAGYPGPARELSKLCQKRGIALIEDCDNALCAQRDGDNIGLAGDFAVYSFYPNRQINCTEGGALACRREEDANRARRLRRFGIDADSFRTAAGEINPASDVSEIGWAVTMNNLCAAIGTVQLEGVRARVDKARVNAIALRDRLSHICGVQHVAPAPNALPAYWVFLIFVQQRDLLLSELKKRGVACSSLHQRNDIYTGFGTLIPVELPNTSRLQDRILALPCGWWLANEDIDVIGDALESAIEALPLQ
jgi:perosamine synthetase